MEFFQTIGSKPIPITEQGKRTFYLYSQGNLTASELPIQLQQFQRRKAELESFPLKAAIAWMNADSTRDLDQATTWLNAKSAGQDYQLYLDATERARAQELQAELLELDRAYPYEIATLMIRNRICDHVEVQVHASAGEDLLAIAPIRERILLHANKELKNHDTGEIVSITEPYRDDGNLHISPLKNPVLKGHVFFLLDKGDISRGDRNWTKEDTYNLITAKSAHGLSQVEQIVKFFEGEEKQTSTRPLSVAEGAKKTRALSAAEGKTEDKEQSPK